MVVTPGGYQRNEQRLGTEKSPTTHSIRLGKNSEVLVLRRRQRSAFSSKEMCVEVFTLFCQISFIGLASLIVPVNGIIMAYKRDTL